MNVLVTHSGLQHANQLAQALYEKGMLQRLITGMPLFEPEQSSLLGHAMGNRVLRTPIPHDLRRHHPLFPLLRRLASRFLPTRTSNSISHRLDHVFDTMVSRQVAQLRPDIVVCYENAALRTFEAAKRTGALCVLDAAGIHYRSSSLQFGVGLEPDPEWINTWKEQELELADVVVACSTFAAETFISNGVPSQKVFACPLGTDIPDMSHTPNAASERLRLIYVGTVRRLKGVDILLDCLADLRGRGVEVSLTIVGSIVDQDVAARAAAMPDVEMVPHCPKPALFDLIARHDCLVLPSRFDSFGMVVPEAMAVGVAAIVSDRVGAKMIIEQHPGSGWIVPLSRRDWTATIARIAADRSVLHSASTAARLAARHFTWTAYRRRISDFLRTTYDAARTGSYGGRLVAVSAARS